MSLRKARWAGFDGALRRKKVLSSTAFCDDDVQEKRKEDTELPNNNKKPN